jgi:hypothetical protein
VETTALDHPPARGRRRLIIALAVVGVGAGVVGVAVVWWRSGAPRQTAKRLAEEGAVALADALFEELVPAA